jgi:hypothetical protein
MDCKRSFNRGTPEGRQQRDVYSFKDMILEKLKYTNKSEAIQIVMSFYLNETNLQ